jgi:hypothetical protein
MKRVPGIGPTCVFALLFVGCASQPEQRAVAQQPTPTARSSAKSDFVITEAMLAAARQYVHAKRSLYTEPVPCNPSEQDRCDTVKIYIIEPEAAGEIFCVGLIPEKINFGAAGMTNREKTIVWEILPPAMPRTAGTLFEFYDESVHISKAPGIAVLNDVNPAQLKNGKLGDGGGGSPNLRFYTMKNDHKKPVDAYYLPIILQTVPASGSTPKKVALCGTPDPRIVND